MNARYEFNLNYLPGKDNKVADAISRLNLNQENEPRLEMNLFIQPFKELLNATRKDNELQTAISENQTGKLIEDDGIIIIMENKEVEFIYPKIHDKMLFDICTIRH